MITSIRFIRTHGIFQRLVIKFSQKLPSGGVSHKKKITHPPFHQLSGRAYLVCNEQTRRCREESVFHDVFVRAMIFNMLGFGSDGLKCKFLKLLCALMRLPGDGFRCMNFSFVRFSPDDYLVYIRNLNDCLQDSTNVLNYQEFRIVS